MLRWFICPVLMTIFSFAQISILYAGDGNEPNNSFLTATTLSGAGSYQGYIETADDYDYYKIEVEAGSFKMTLVPSSNTYMSLYLRLYNSARSQIYSNNGSSSFTLNKTLEAGTYYIRINEGSGRTSNHSYTFTLDGASLGTPDRDGNEPNNSFLTATTLSGAGSYQGYIETTDDYDYYKIEVEAGSFKMTLVPSSNTYMNLYLRLYNSARSQIYSNNGSSSFTLNKTLEAGTYYIRINEGSGRTSNYSYTFTLDSHGPEVKDIAGITKSEDFTPFAIQVEASDQDGDTITFSLNSSNPGVVQASIDSNSGLIRISPIANASGNTTLTVIATANGASASKNFTITINPVEDVPELAHLNDISKNEDFSAFPIQTTATDPDGDTITYTLSSSNSSVAFVSINRSSGLISVSPIANAYGNTTVTVTATAEGGSDTQSFQLTVNPLDDAPVIPTLGDITKEENFAAFTIDVNAVDAEGDTIVYSLANSDSSVASASINSNTGRISVSSILAVNGNTTLTVNAEANGKSDSESFLLTVSDVAHEPVLQPIASVTRDEDFTPFMIQAEASDLDGDTILFSLSSSQSGVVQASIDSHSGLISINPIVNAYGSTTLTVTATASGKRVSKSFSVTIDPIDDAPEITALGNRSKNEDFTAFSIQVDATDPEGETIAYALSNSNTNVVTATIDTKTGLIQISPVSNASGSTTLTVTTTAGSKSNSEDFTLTVNAVDDPVVLNPLGSITKNEDFTAFTVQSQAFDGDGDTITYSINTVAYASETHSGQGSTRNGVVSMDFAIPPNTEQVKMTLRMGGDYDDSGEHSTVSFNSHTLESVSPDAGCTRKIPSGWSEKVIEPAYWKAGETATITLAASYDVAGLCLPWYYYQVTLDYKIRVANASINSSTGLVSISPIANASGTTTMTVTASAGGDTVSRSFNLVVKAVDDPPSLASLGNVTKDEDFSAFTIQANATDTEGDVITYTLTSTDNSVASTSIDSNSGLIDISPILNASGTTILTAKASAGGKSHSRDFTLTVNAVDDPLVLSSLTDITKNEDFTAFTVQANATDPDSGDIVYTLSNSDTSTASISIDSSSGLISIAPIANASGTSKLEVTATVQGDSATESLTLKVNPIDDAPEIATLGNLTKTENFVAFTIQSSAVDAEGNEIIYSLTQSDNNVANVSINSVSGLIEVSPILAAHGSTTITVTATANGKTDHQNFILTVSDIAHDPVLQPIDNITKDEDFSVFTVQAEASDQDGDTIVFSLSSSKQDVLQASIDSASGLITITPIGNAFGNTTLTVTATASGTSVNKSFLVTVNSLDDAPEIAILGNLVKSEDFTPFTIQASATDTEGDSIIYSLSNSNSNVANVSIDKDTGLISVSPASNASGLTTVTVTATAAGNSSSRNFTLTVNGINDPLVLGRLSNITKNEDFTAFTVQSLATDSDGSTITYALDAVTHASETRTGQGSTRNGVVSMNFAVPKNTQRVKMTLSMGGDYDDSGEYSIISVNQDILGTATPNAACTRKTPSGWDNKVINPIYWNAGETVTIELTASNDVAGLCEPWYYYEVTLDYEIAVVDASIDNSSGLISISPISNANGIATLTVTATSGSDSSSESFTLTVDAVDDPPVLASLEDMTKDEDFSAFTVQANASDVEGETVLYALTNAHSNVASASINSHTGVINIFPVANADGATTLTVIATAGSKSSSEDFILTVTAVDDPLVLASLSPVTKNEDFTAFTVQASATDPDSHPIHYALGNSDTSTASVSIDSDSGLISITPIADAYGTSNLIVTASVPGDSMSQNFLLTVNAMDDAPILAPIANVTMDEGFETFNIETSAHDVDGDTITYALTPFNSDKVSASINEQTGVLTIESSSIASETLTLMVTAMAKNQSDSQSFTLTVLNVVPQVQIDFPVSDEVLIAGQSMNFESTGIGGNGDLSYDWDFGGGATKASVEDPSNVIFPQAGTFTVTLTATDSDGDTAKDTRTITVEENVKPVVTVDDLPSAIVEGHAVQLQAVGSKGNGELSYDWDFGEGIGDSTNNSSASVTFSSSGTYTISVTVTDVDGETDTHTFTVSVEVDTQPTIVIDSPEANTTTRAGRAIHFSATGSGGNGFLNYFWDFDGGASNLLVQDPGEVVFSQPGNYSVTITATDIDGDEAFDSRIITVYDIYTVDLPSFVIASPLQLSPVLKYGPLEQETTMEQWQFTSLTPEVTSVAADGTVSFHKTAGGIIEVTHKEHNISGVVYVYSSANQIEFEPNDELDEGINLLSESPTEGRLFIAQDEDYFRFVVEHPQTQHFFFDNPGNGADFEIELLTDSGTTLFQMSSEDGADVSRLNIALTMGVYFLKVRSGENHSAAWYSVIRKPHTILSDFCDDNQSPEKACELQVGNRLSGRFLSESQAHYYEIPLISPSNLQLNLSTELEAETYHVSLFSSGILAGFASLVDFEHGLPATFGGDWQPIKTEAGNTVMRSNRFPQECSEVEQIVGFEHEKPASFSGNWKRRGGSGSPQGNWALKSHSIGHRQQSEIEVEAITGSLISFDYRVSSETFDHLIFKIDGETVESWSGDTGWQNYKHPVTAGRHTFKWIYQKDKSVSEYQDAAWIDAVDLGDIESCHFPASVFEAGVNVEEDLSFRYRMQGNDSGATLQFFVDDEPQATLCDKVNCNEWQKHELSVSRGYHRFRWLVSGGTSDLFFEVDDFNKLINPNLLAQNTTRVMVEEPQTLSYALQPGRYFLRIEANDSGLENLYELSLETETGDTEYEPNNTHAFPNTLEQHQTISGNFSTLFDEDVFMFRQTTQGPFNFQLIPDSGDTEVELILYNGDQTPVPHPPWSTSGTDMLEDKVGLKPGNYTIRLLPKSNGAYAQNSGYQLNITSAIEPLTQLLSLEVQAANAPLLNQSVDLSVIGHYLDGNTLDLTEEVTWFLSNHNATLNNDHQLTITQEGSITVKASYQGIIGSKSFQIGQKMSDQTYGNLILVAGGGLSSNNPLKEATQYLTKLAYQKFLGRGFEDQDIFYFNPAREHDIDGDGVHDNIVDSSEMTVDALGKAITEWAVEQDSSGPLHLYLNDHGGAGRFEIFPGAVITSSELDGFLETFQTKTGRAVIVVIEACKSGTFIDDIAKTNRMVITSADHRDSYLSSSGTLSFSQIFWSRLFAGESFEDAYDEANLQLGEYGRPYTLQFPQFMDLGGLASSKLGGDFSVAGLFPDIVDYSGSNSAMANTPTPLFAQISALDQVKEVTAVITPPNYIPPSLTEDLEAPEVNLPVVTLRDEDAQKFLDGKYEGEYTFTFNGPHQVIFTVRDQYNNVSSSPPILIDVTGGEDPWSWDLLSFPQANANGTPIEQFFTEAQQQIVRLVWSWEDDGWKLWSPHKSIEQLNAEFAKYGGVTFESFETLPPNRGYWLNHFSPQPFTFSGTLDNSSTLPPLDKGWNLVGFGENHEGSVAEIMESNSDIHSIWAWKDKQWHVHFRDPLDHPYLSLDQIQIGVGYWVQVK